MALRYVSRFAFLLSKLDVAMTVLRMVDELCVLCPEQALSSSVQSISKRILCTRWKNGNKVEHLDFLLKKRFELLDDEHLLDALDHYVGTVLKAWIEKDVELLERNEFLSKETFPVYYRVLFGEITKVLSRIKDYTDDESAFEILLRICELFVMSVDVIVSIQEKSVVSTALKSGKKFIDLFNKHLPFFKRNFSAYKGKQSVDNSVDKTVKIFKVLQRSTRQLQFACNDSKISKEKGLISSVPGLKRSLEKFVYEVKASEPKLKY